MKVDIPEPCHEDWDAMPARGCGRYCDACETTVLDFSRMTKRQAAAAIREAGPELCGNVAFDTRTGEPVFRPEPSRARRWAGGLVLVAALTQGCAEAESPIGAPVGIVEDPPPCELGPPMQPLEPMESVESAEPAPEIPGAAHDVDAGQAPPTPGTRPPRPAPPASPDEAHPPIRHLRGRMIPR